MRRVLIAKALQKATPVLFALIAIAGTMPAGLAMLLTGVMCALAAVHGSSSGSAAAVLHAARDPKALGCGLLSAAVTA
jgi:hypothetical protein